MYLPPPWTNQHFATVSSMPKNCPLPGCEYLRRFKHVELPVRYCSCSPCYGILPSAEQSPEHEYEEEKGCVMLERGDLEVESPEFLFHTGDGGQHKVEIVSGLLSGDTQRRIIHPNKDWTTDWDWALECESCDPASGWRLRASFYFRDLPSCLQGGVLWSDEAETGTYDVRGPPVYISGAGMACRWLYTMAFFDRAKPPRWCAVMALSHESSDVLADVNFWDYLSPRSTYR